MNKIKFIGMDVHKATNVIAVLDGTGKLVTEAIIENKSAAILDFIKSQRGTLWVAFEEGTYATWLYDLISPHVAKLLVCDPRKSKLLLESGNKGDKLDAQRIAVLLRNGLLKPVYHGENSTRALKELAQSHTALVGDCTRVKNRIKAIFRGRGIECNGGGVYRVEERETWLNRLKGEAVQRRADRLLRELEYLVCLCQEAEREMVMESRKHAANKILRSIPGVADVRAALILAFVITPHRFRTKRQLWKYIGLGLVTRGSSEYEIVGGRVKRSKKAALPRGLNRNYNRVLKNVFKGAAATAAQGPLQGYFKKLVDRGLSPNVALVMLARKISAITLALWKKGERYDKARLMKQMT
jgi:transposase